MIIVPELETVVILVPRTGSGSLKQALLATYPNAFMPYRHMEADGVPHGYDRWARVGVIRNPIDRLHSLYKFCKRGRNARTYDCYPSYWDALEASVERSFEDWLVHNDLAFTNAYCSHGSGFNPQFSVLHSIPENRKSAFFYLRPDLGTEILQFSDIRSIEARLGVQLGHRNETERTERPHLSPEAMRHMVAFHQWDFEAAR